MSLRRLSRRQQKACRILGWLSIGIFALLLLAWLQNGDPDCYLSTALALQLRMCSDELLEAAPATSPILLPLALLALGIGLVLLKPGRASAGRQQDER